MIGLTPCIHNYIFNPEKVKLIVGQVDFGQTLFWNLYAVLKNTKIWLDGKWKILERFALQAIQYYSWSMWEQG